MGFLSFRESESKLDLDSPLDRDYRLGYGNDIVPLNEDQICEIWYIHKDSSLIRRIKGAVYDGGSEHTYCPPYDLVAFQPIPDDIGTVKELIDFANANHISIDFGKFIIR